MSPEKLHQLVKSLSKEQKSFFRRTLKGKKTLDVILYDRLSKVGILSKENLLKVRGKEFHNASHFHHYRIQLAERIINSLISQSGHGFEAVAFIRRAYFEDLPEIGEKHLINQFQVAEEKEDFARIIYLYEFVSKLEEETRLKINLSWDGMNKKQATLLQDECRSISTISDRIKDTFSKNAETKLFLKKRIEKEISTISPSSFSAKCEWLKLKARLEIAVENFVKAQYHQSQLVELLNSRSYTSDNVAVLEEIVQLIRLSIFTNDRETAFRTLQMLEGFSTCSILQQKNKIKNRIITGISLADHYSNTELATRLKDEFAENQSLFSDREAVLNWYFLGLTYFNSNSFSKALTCFLKVKQFPRDKWERMGWELEAVISISHFETGQLEESTSAFRASSRLAKEKDTLYPTRTIQIIKEFLSAGSLDDIDLIQKELNSLIEDPNEKRATLFFNIQLWLFGKATGNLPAELIRSYGKVEALEKVS